MRSHPRWWYLPPTSETVFCFPKARIYRCGDEFCNDTLFLQMPFLGELTIRINSTIRVDGKCEECVAEFGPWCPGCKECHQGPRCHNWHECTTQEEAHESKLGRCPACAGQYCTECETEPRTSCPYRGEKL